MNTLIYLLHFCQSLLCTFAKVKHWFTQLSLLSPCLTGATVKRGIWDHYMSAQCPLGTYCPSNHLWEKGSVFLLFPSLGWGTFSLPFTRLTIRGCRKYWASEALWNTAGTPVYNDLISSIGSSVSFQTSRTSSWRWWGWREPWRWVRSTPVWRVLGDVWPSAPL